MPASESADEKYTNRNNNNPCLLKKKKLYMFQKIKSKNRSKKKQQQQSTTTSMPSQKVPLMFDPFDGRDENKGSAWQEVSFESLRGDPNDDPVNDILAKEHFEPIIDTYPDEKVIGDLNDSVEVIDSLSVEGKCISQNAIDSPLSSTLPSSSLGSMEESEISKTISRDENTSVMFDPFNNLDNFDSMISTMNNDSNMDISNDSWQGAPFDSIDGDNNNMVEDTSATSPRHNVSETTVKNSESAFDPYDHFDSMSTANSEITLKAENKFGHSVFLSSIQKIGKQIDDNIYIGRKHGFNIDENSNFDEHEDQSNIIPDSAFGISNTVMQGRPTNPSVNLRALAMQQNELFYSTGAAGKRDYYDPAKIDQQEGDNDSCTDTSVFDFSSSLGLVPGIISPNQKAMSDSGTDVFDGISSVAGPLVSKSTAIKLFTKVVSPHSSRNEGVLLEKLAKEVKMEPNENVSDGIKTIDDLRKYGDSIRKPGLSTLSDSTPYVGSYTSDLKLDESKTALNEHTEKDKDQKKGPDGLRNTGRKNSEVTLLPLPRRQRHPQNFCVLPTKDLKSRATTKASVRSMTALLEFLAHRQLLTYQNKR